MQISLYNPKYKEQKERMFSKIRETTLAQDDEISKNIVGLARTRPDIFGTTEEEVSNAVKAEIEKKNDEQPKQVIWDGNSDSIGRTANQAMSQNIESDDQSDAYNNEFKNLPGPAAPPPRPGIPSVRPLPPPPGLALNVPCGPMHNMQYSNPNSIGLPLPPPRPGMHMMQSLRPPPMHPSFPRNNQGIPIPPPPGSQFTPVPVSRPYVPHLHPPSAMMPMMHPPPPPQGVSPPPPPEEAPPSHPEEPKPKRQKHDDSALIPEDKFLTQHQGPSRISISVPNVDEGNLKGKVLEITVQSLSETVGSLKEKIAGENQLPANKQKLSGKPGFLKDNMSLAYYNVSGGEILSLALRERGGRKR
ncbi:putative splicing factor 3A subunit 1 [Medicago truncatula]|uniref:Putative splicing factor 3A subunit 1 n=1 Tax=Medicago truncatula TaxID=3880 RepID=A0A396H3D7_MEDTR|nr:putative splicing factor 3A subunit 1 [Medicago truncatula]